MNSRDKPLRLGYIADSPLAFDGKCYRYSTGEWRYLERIAYLFDQVDVCARVVEVEKDATTDVRYANVLKVANAKIVPLDKVGIGQPSRNWLSKQWQALRVLNRQTKDWDFGFFMMPSWFTLYGWAQSRIRNWPYAVCARADWPGAARHRFPQNKILLLTLPLYLFGLREIESRILHDALIRMTEGYSLSDRYPHLADSIIPTLTLELSPTQFRERKDTCQLTPIKVVYVGSLEARKGIDVSIRSIARLRNTGHDIEFHIAGDGPDTGPLDNLASELGIRDHVKFHGTIETGASVLDFCHDGDIFLLNSYSEGFPRVLYEAMSQSLPVVTTAVGSIPLLLKDQETAILIKCGDVDDTSNALKRVVSNGPLRRRLIRNGYQFAYRVIEDDPIHQAVNALEDVLYRLNRGP